MNPKELKYTESHEWLRIEGNQCYVGITEHAQDQLGDLVFVELPEAGTELEKGDVLGNVESVKSVSEIYAPIPGTIAKVNEALLDNPELINQDPYGEGWIAILEIAEDENMDNLLTVEEYESQI